MAASSALNSRSWILKTGDFNALLDAGNAQPNDLDDIIAGDFKDNVFKGLQQFYYWNRRFQDWDYDKLVTLALMDGSGLIKPDVQALITAIDGVLGDNQIVSINYPENTNFISFLLESTEAALKVRLGVQEVNGAQACFTRKLGANAFRIKILWAPPYYQLDELESALLVWCSSVHLAFEQETFMNGRLLYNNRAVGMVSLKEGISLNTLPHVIKLPHTKNKFVLLVINERPPMCLRCRRVGHMRNRCDLVKCKKCLLRHSTLSECYTKSYATALRKTSETSHALMDLADKSAEHCGKVAKITVPEFSTSNSLLDSGVFENDLQVQANAVCDNKDSGPPIVEVGATSEVPHPTDNDETSFVLVNRKGAAENKLSGAMQNQNNRHVAACKTNIPAQGRFSALVDEMDWTGSGDSTPKDIYDPCMNNSGSSPILINPMVEVDGSSSNLKEVGTLTAVPERFLQKRAYCNSEGVCNKKSRPLSGGAVLTALGSSHDSSTGFKEVTVQGVGLPSEADICTAPSLDSHRSTTGMMTRSSSRAHANNLLTGLPILGECSSKSHMSSGEDTLVKVDMVLDDDVIKCSPTPETGVLIEESDADQNCFEIIFHGFPPDISRAEVRKWLTDYNPNKLWRCDEDDDALYHSIIVSFYSEEEAIKALEMDNHDFHGYIISANRFP